MTGLTAKQAVFIISNLDNLVSVDIETKGNNAANYTNRTVGIGLADSKDIYYIDRDSAEPGAFDFLIKKLADSRKELFGHNIFFDSAFLAREFPKDKLNWKYCTYGLLRQLSTEGWDGQTWGLKDAQINLLGWEETNEGELDGWLVNNNLYHEDLKKEPQGSHQYPVTNTKGELRYARPMKGEMYKAPADILGFYCGLDSASTYLLLTNVIIPSLRAKLPEVAVESFFTYHQTYIVNTKLLVEQQLYGVTIDTDKLKIYHEELLKRIDTSKVDFLNTEEVKKYINQFKNEALEELKRKEPAKFKKHTLPKEPTKYLKSGKLSQNWLNWRKKVEADTGPEVSKNWLNWNESLTKLEEEWEFNLNSAPLLRTLLYDRMGYPIKVLTDSELPATDSSALKLMGPVVKDLQLYKDLVKEEGYIRACLDKQYKNRLNLQFRNPGTLTGRLAGSGGLNVQQLPKSRGYLECWVPRPGHVWIDCFVEGTEILTKQGWKDILELKEGEEIWQVDKDSLEGSWAIPSRLISQEYEGEIYNIGNRRGGLRVTPNHKMLYAGQQSRNSDKHKRYVQLAHEEIRTGLELILSSKSNLKTEFSEESIWMACMLQADGHLGTKSKGTGYTIQVSKLRKRKKVAELLGRQGHVYNRPGKLEIEQWSGVHFKSPFYSNKKFNLVGILGSNQAAIFVDALSFWDGTTTRDGAIIYTTTEADIADEVQAYLTTSGYEARLSHRKYGNEDKLVYQLRIKNRASIRLRTQDRKTEHYRGKIGCVTVPSGFILTRYEGQTVVCGQCDINSLEQVVLAELSRDKSLLSLYGPGAKPNDVYLFNGANMLGIKDKIRQYYDPENPTEESIAKAKKECKKERSIAKVITLASSYGAGADKLFNTLSLDGIDISMNEVRELHKSYWNIYAGVRAYGKTLEQEWEYRNGWVYNGIGRPIGVHHSKKKDLVNRVVQSTGHDILMMIIEELEVLRQRYIKSNKGLIWRPIIIDFHDESIVECKEEDSQRVLDMFREAYQIVNQKLGGVVKIEGEPEILRNLADAKIKE